MLAFKILIGITVTLFLFAIIYSFVVNSNNEGKVEQFDDNSVSDYLGNLADVKTKITIKPSNLDKDKDYMINDSINDSTNNDEYAYQAEKHYFREIKKYYNLLKNKYPNIETTLIFVPGDVTHSRNDIPIISKTRPIADKGLNVLLPLNNKRHWDSLKDVRKCDIPFSKKKNGAIWRGVATGIDKRVALVENWRYFPNKDVIDIAFTKFDSNYRGSHDEGLLSKTVPICDMLKYKYIISVEGNDVATNLKWILSSNSVCIMPQPTIESWLLESKLIPWVHYVPVNRDFSNLLEVINHCNHNQQQMMTIVKNANTYMNKFKGSWDDIVVNILKEYADKTQFVYTT